MQIYHVIGAPMSIHKSHENMISDLEARILKTSASLLARDPQAVTAFQCIEELTSVAGQAELVIDIISAMVPGDIEPAIWLEWFAGGRAPSSVSEIAPPKRTKTKPLQELERTVGRVDAKHSRAAELDKEAESLRQKADEISNRAAVERKIESQEQHRARGLVLSMIMTKLAQTTNGVFAMGPAWTILRAISTLPDKDMIMRDLDALSSDEDFLNELGATIVQAWINHRQKVETFGLRRGQYTIKNSLPQSENLNSLEETLSQLRPSYTEVENLVDTNASTHPRELTDSSEIPWLEGCGPDSTIESRDF